MSDNLHTLNIESYGNLRTRMCKSIDRDMFCLHGEKCRFAHSLKELVTRNCLFNDSCRFVRFKNGKLVNNGSNICMNKHPYENQDDFMERTGLVKYKTLSSKKEVEKSFSCDSQTNYRWAASIKSSLDSFAPTTSSLTPPVPIGGFGYAPTTSSLTPPVPIGGFGYAPTTSSLTPPVPIGGFGYAPTTSSLTPPVPIGGFGYAPTTSSLTPPVPIGGFGCAPTTSGSSLSTPNSSVGCVSTCSSNLEEIVFRVPKEFAMQALQVAMNSGNRCIRVESK